MRSINTTAHTKRDLTSGPLARTLISLAAPLGLNILLDALYSTVDAFWLGKLSKEALAAPGVSMPLLFVVSSLGMGFGTAGTALVAQHVGAGRHRQADHAAAQTILLLCGLTLTLCLPALILARQVLHVFGVPDDALSQATIYLRLRMAGLPLVALLISYGAVLRALGDTVTVVIIGFVANLVNMVLDPFLIFGLAGLPAMGTLGAALATLCSQAAAALACLIMLRRGRAGLHITRHDFRPHFPTLRRIVSVGVPAAVSNASTSMGFTIYMSMVNKMGTAVIGAYTIGFRLIHLFQVPSQAMSMAAAPVVGQSLGAGKPRLARKAVWLSARIVAAITLLPYASMLVAGKLMARLFTSDPEVLEEARRFFMVVPISSYFFGVLLTLMAAFYGSGHTRPAMILSIVRLWVLRVPVAYLLGFTLRMGSVGLYWGMAIANIVGALLTLWLFMAGGWQTGLSVPTDEQAKLQQETAEPEGAAASQP